MVIVPAQSNTTYAWSGTHLGNNRACHTNHNFWTRRCDWLQGLPTSGHLSKQQKKKKKITSEGDGMDMPNPITRANPRTSWQKQCNYQKKNIHSRSATNKMYTLHKHKHTRSHGFKNWIVERTEKRSSSHIASRIGI